MAHSLYDRYASTRESEELKYIPPSECVTRDSELAGAKPSKTLQTDASRSNLVFKDEEIVNEMNLVSDLELYQAMLRRALAASTRLGGIGDLQHGTAVGEAAVRDCHPRSTALFHARVKSADP